MAHQICNVVLPQKNDARDADGPIRQCRLCVFNPHLFRDKYIQPGVVCADSRHVGGAAVKYESFSVCPNI